MHSDVVSAGNGVGWTVLDGSGRNLRKLVEGSNAIPVVLKHGLAVGPNRRVPGQKVVNGHPGAVAKHNAPARILTQHQMPLAAVGGLAGLGGCGRPCAVVNGWCRDAPACQGIDDKSTIRNKVDGSALDDLFS